MNRPDYCPSVTVLICSLNEEESLPYVLPKIPEWVDEIILIGGQSKDRTIELAKELQPKIEILQQTGKGKGDALRYGIEHASGDIIVTLDADNATDPEEMYKFIAPLLEGYDFAKGTRFTQGFPPNKPKHRIVGNLIITMLFNLLFFRWYTDLCSGYNAFWKRSIERANFSPHDGFENEPLLNTRVRKAGLKIIEVGHLDKGRLKGEVKESSWRQGFKAVKTIIRERFCGL